MNTQSILLRVIVFLGLGASCCSCVESGQAESKALNEPLALSMQVTAHTGMVFVNAVATNRSAEFVCLSADTFDPLYPSFVFLSANGVPLPRTNAGNRDRLDELGFDYSDRYFILRPKESRTFAVHWKQVIKERGTYRYQFHVPYFRCRDVIDAERVKRREDIPRLFAEADGTVVIPSGAAEN